MATKNHNRRAIYVMDWIHCCRGWVDFADIDASTDFDKRRRRSGMRRMSGYINRFTSMCRIVGAF